MPLPPEGATPREGLAFRGKHWRLWVGMDGIARLMVEGDQDKATIEALLDALATLGDKLAERPVRLLVYAHRPLSLRPEAREMLVQACRAHVTTRLAVVRASPLARIQARFIERRSGHAFSYHENEREALRALGEAEPAPPKPAAPQAPDVGVLDHIA